MMFQYVPSQNKVAQEPAVAGKILVVTEPLANEVTFEDADTTAKPLCVFTDKNLPALDAGVGKVIVAVEDKL